MDLRQRQNWAEVARLGCHQWMTCALHADLPRPAGGSSAQVKAGESPPRWRAFGGLGGSPRHEVAAERKGTKTPMNTNGTSHQTQAGIGHIAPTHRGRHVQNRSRRWQLRRGRSRTRRSAKSRAVTGPRQWRLTRVAAWQPNPRQG